MIISAFFEVPLHNKNIIELVKQNNWNVIVKPNQVCSSIKEIYVSRTLVCKSIINAITSN